MKKVISHMVGIIAVLLMAPVSGSAEEAGRPVTVSPVAGFYLPASGIDGLKTGVLAGLRVDTPVDDVFGLEGDIGYLRSRRNGSTQNAYLFSMQLLYSFLVRRNLIPFAAFGVGGIIFEGGKSGPTMSVGVGAKYFLWEGLAIRGDLRDVAALRSADNNIEFTIGVSYLFDAGSKGGAASRLSQEGTGDEERIPAPASASAEVDKTVPAAPAVPVPAPAEVVKTAPTTPTAAAPDLTEPKKAAPAAAPSAALIAAPPEAAATAPAAPAPSAVTVPGPIEGAKVASATPAATALIPAEIEKEIPSAPVVPSPAPSEMERVAPVVPPVSAGGPKETRKAASAASSAAPVSTPVEAEKEMPAAPATPVPAPGDVERAAPAVPPAAPEVAKTIMPAPSATTPEPAEEKPAETAAAKPVRGAKVFTGITFTADSVVLNADGGIGDFKVPNIPSVTTKSGLAGIPAEGEHLVLSSVVAGDLEKELAAIDLSTCPDQPVAGKVEIPGTLLQETFEFNTNRFNIRRDFFKAAQRIARFMKNNPETSALILGHADNTGRVDHNVMLSQKRGESVKNYLTRRFGIAPARLGIKAFGCSWPLGDNRTAEGRRKNRMTATIITGTAE